jgi:hypothetical protein
MATPQEGNFFQAIPHSRNRSLGYQPVIAPSLTMPTQAPRIPDKVWDQHKEEIIAFHVAHSLDRTMNYMEEKYGFQARYISSSPGRPSA